MPSKQPSFYVLAALWLAITFVSISQAAVGQERGNKFLALVIGNAQYSISPIKGPDKDAEDIAQLLSNAGFDVTNKERTTNLDRSAMQQKIAEFVSRIDRDSVAVFYYSGHGVEIANSNFLAPIDADGESVGKLIPLDDILKRLDQRDALTKVIILDACRDTPSSMRYKKAFDSGGLASIKFLGSGTSIVFATEPGKIALAAHLNSRNSVFTESLIAAAAHESTFSGLILRAAEITQSATGNFQRPWLQGNISTSIPIGNANRRVSLLTPGSIERSNDSKKGLSESGMEKCFVFNNKTYCE